MAKVRHIILLVLFGLLTTAASAQVNTDQVMRIGRNALFFEDYMLSIQYFNQVISAKPYMAEPYLMRGIAKVNLDDYAGAEADATKAIELNPFLTDAYEVRGVARQNMGKRAEAVKDYDKALELLPRNRQLLFNKALAHTDLHEYAGADSTFALLLRHYPNFSSGYLGKARLRLLEGDTISAEQDIAKALSLNSKEANAYIMRADIAINSHRDYQSALADIDEAIKLQPRTAGLYINRAFLRYNLDNYNGAMSDYEQALQLEPGNATALFNRGLLLAQVSANDLALEDFNRVLELDPDDYRALYNRALIHRAKGNYAEAEADAMRVAEKFPRLPEAYYLLGNIRESRGRLEAAEADYRHGRELARSMRPNESSGGEEAAEERPESPEAVARRFSGLLTVEDNAEIQQEYNNSAIRGRVQDRHLNIEPEEPLMLTFYTSPSELRPATHYIKEVDELNATRALRFVLMVSNAVPAIDESTSARHFQSIDYYNSYIATHTPRPVDYVGRALDFLTVRDYASALRDAERVISMAPSLPIGHLIATQARYGQYLLDKDGSDVDSRARAAIAQAQLDAIIADLDKVLALSPDNAVAWYNKGCILYMAGRTDAAAAAYTTAIDLKPDFGEAYFNRGYIELSQGKQNIGTSDLGKAGEYGIVPAYNLIKRLRQ